MTWKHVNGYGMPQDDGEYLVAYRSGRAGGWSVVTATFENDRFDCDHSPPYIELWTEIPPLPNPASSEDSRE